MKVQRDKKVLNKKCISYDDNSRCINRIKSFLLIYKNKAVGVAANQLFMKNRVFGIWYKGKIMIFENPVIISYTSEALIDSDEGCLSIKGGKKVYPVKRPQTVVIKDDINGEQTFSNYYSTVICHEMDHLEGKLISQTTSWKENYGK